MFAAVTVLARNYVPRAQVLAASFRQHHPGARLVALVVDGDADVPGAEVVSPAWAGIGDDALHRRAALYDRQGVASSHKWAALLTLLDEGAEAAILVDPDMLVLAPIDDVAEQALLHGIVLSAHPVGTDTRRFGAYNGGFLAASDAGRPFLACMARRMRRECLRHSGLFYGQRLLDLAAREHGAHVLDDPGINVLPTSYGAADIEWIDDRPLIRGVPLRLAHLAGYDLRRPGELCRYFPGDPDMRLAGRPGLNRLYGEYRQSLLAAGHPLPDEWPWRQTADGLRYDGPMRHAFTRAQHLSDGGAESPPPDPFDPDAPGAFTGWLAQPVGLSRYLKALHELRDDLREAFPRVEGVDTAAYLAWAQTASIAEVPEPFRPPLAL